MAGHNKMTAAKRQCERDLAERRRDKLARRIETRRAKQSDREQPAGTDPDIAGIVPGPQPLPAWWQSDE